MNENRNQTERAVTEAQYVAPAIEIMEVETSQNILGGSIEDIPPGGWL